MIPLTVRIFLHCYSSYLTDEIQSSDFSPWEKRNVPIVHRCVCIYKNKIELPREKKKKYHLIPSIEQRKKERKKFNGIILFKILLYNNIIEFFLLSNRRRNSPSNTVYSTMLIPFNTK